MPLRQVGDADTSRPSRTQCANSHGSSLTQVCTDNRAGVGKHLWQTVSTIPIAYHKENVLEEATSFG